jgi:integrase
MPMDAMFITMILQMKLPNYATRRRTIKSASSQRNDASMIAQYIEPAIGKMAVSDVRRRDVEQMFHGVVKLVLNKETGKKIAVNKYRANRVLALTKTMFNWVIDRDELDLVNPCRGIKRNKEHGREAYLSEQQIENLKAALDQSESPDAADAIRLLILTGAREMEVLHAEWSQFDLKQRTWTITRTKEDKQKELMLSPAAVLLLDELRKRSKGRFLFPHRDDPSKPRESILGAWITALKRAGLAERIEIPGAKRRKVLIRWKPIRINGHRLRFHDLRHSFASFLISHGVPLKIAGELMGHSRAETTQRYAHIMRDAKRAAADLMGTVWTGKPKGDLPIN